MTPEKKVELIKKVVLYVAEVMEKEGIEPGVDVFEVCGAVTGVFLPGPPSQIPDDNILAMARAVFAMGYSTFLRAAGREREALAELDFCESYLKKVAEKVEKRQRGTVNEEDFA